MTSNCSGRDTHNNSYKKNGMETEKITE